MIDDDLDQLRGGPNAIRALIHLTSPSGRPFITRHNLSAIGVKEGGYPVTLRVVTTRTSDSRKDEFAEIFKAAYFREGGQHHLLVMYDWNIARSVMSEVIAPILFDIFDFAEGDILTSALVELVATTESITRTSRALKWAQRLLGSASAETAVSRNAVTLHIALLTREELGVDKHVWKLRSATKAVNDFHVSPKGRIAVISDQQAFEIEPKVLVRAIKGAGYLDVDFSEARDNGFVVGPNAVLSRYTPSGYPFNIAVYDDGKLRVHRPDTNEVVAAQESDQFIMTSNDGSGVILAVERTVRGRRKVASRTSTPSAATMPIPSSH